MNLIAVLSQDTGIVFEHILRNLDNSVSPCENLYRHVCPKNLPRRETVHSKTARLFIETIKQNHHHPRSLQQFSIVREEARLAHHQFNVDVLVKEFHQRCERNVSTINFLRLLQSFFDSAPDNMFLPQLSYLAHIRDCRSATRSLQHILWALNVPKISPIISQSSSHVALLISATVGKLKQIQYKANYLFEQMRALLIDWLKSDFPNQEKFIEAALNRASLQFYGETELRAFRKIFNIGNRYYRRCKSQEKATSLEMLTVCNRIASQLIEHLIENEPIFHSYFKSYRFSSFNAIFDNNQITILPQRLLLANTNQTSIFLGALSVLGHELAHAIVPHILKNNPAAAYEISQIFRKTCRDYREAEKTDNTHSARYVRVNGAARMQNEFRNAFKCSRNDRMTLIRSENNLLH